MDEFEVHPVDITCVSSTNCHCPPPQNSFYKLMMGDNKSEKFFKVLHDRMKEAQTEIKATVSVNVGEMTHKANEKELESGEAPPTPHPCDAVSFEG